METSQHWSGPGVRSTARANKNRRDFLKGSIAATLSLASVGSLLCAAEITPLRLFGYSLYGMKSLPLNEALAAVAKIGYDAVELACMPGFRADPDQLSTSARLDLQHQLADYQLTLVSLMENIPPLVSAEVLAQHRLRLEKACDLARALNPDHPPLIETVLGGQPGQWDAVKTQLVERLGDWAKLVESKGLVLAIKPHVSGAVHRPESAVWLMEQIRSPWLRVAYDYSHYKLRDIPLTDSLQALIPYTVFVHVKDAHGTADKPRFALPGTEGIDYPSYFRQLQAAKYLGPVVVEVSAQLQQQPAYDPIAAARLSFEQLKKPLEYWRK